MHIGQGAQTMLYVVCGMLSASPPTHYEYLNVIGTMATAVLHLEWANTRVSE